MALMVRALSVCARHRASSQESQALKHWARLRVVWRSTLGKVKGTRYTWRGKRQDGLIDGDDRNYVRAKEKGAASLQPLLLIGAPDRMNLGTGLRPFRSISLPRSSSNRVPDKSSNQLPPRQSEP
jgi:hypothetical protein